MQSHICPLKTSTQSWLYSVFWFWPKSNFATRSFYNSLQFHVYPLNTSARPTFQLVLFSIQILTSYCLSPSSFAKPFHIENEVSGNKAPCLSIRRIIEILASTTDTVFVNSTNISGNTETAMLPNLVRTKHIHDRRELGQVVTLGFSCQSISQTPQNSECRGRVQTRKQKAPSQNTDTKIRPAGQKQESIHIVE